MDKKRKSESLSNFPNFHFSRKSNTSKSISLLIIVRIIDTFHEDFAIIYIIC